MGAGRTKPEARLSASRTRPHPAFQLFFQSRPLLLCPFLGINSTIAPTAYFTTPITDFYSHALTHNARIQRTILILFLDLFDRGSQHLSLNCVPSTIEPPPIVQPNFRISLRELWSRRLGKRLVVGSACRDCMKKSRGLEANICVVNEE